MSEAQRSEQEGDIREAGNPPSRSPTSDYADCSIRIVADQRSGSDRYGA